MKIGLSACLAGQKVRYDGKEKRNDELMRLLAGNEVFLLCPEVSGGLPVPRIPAERIKGRVINKAGADVSENYMQGSRKCLRILKENNVFIAILKARSPACGKGMIYDGTFSGSMTERDGTFAELCRQEGIAVFTEEEIEEIKKVIRG